jgi:hypothetical protein
MIQRISEGEINDMWVKALVEFDSKFAPLHELEKRGIKAVEDIKPVFELLKARVLPIPNETINVGVNSNPGFPRR